MWKWYFFNQGFKLTALLTKCYNVLTFFAVRHFVRGGVHKANVLHPWFTFQRTWLVCPNLIHRWICISCSLTHVDNPGISSPSELRLSIILSLCQGDNLSSLLLFQSLSYSFSGEHLEEIVLSIHPLAFHSSLLLSVSSLTSDRNKITF